MLGNERNGPELAPSMLSMEGCEALSNTDLARNHQKSILENQIVEMLIRIKMDAECNETTLSISFDRFHKDFEILTEMTSNAGQKSLRNIIKC